MENTPILSDPLSDNDILDDTTEYKHNERLAAFVGGTLGAFAGLVVWSIIAYVMETPSGFLVIGVGCLVGFGVQWMAMSKSVSLGMLAAALTFIGALLGSFLSLLMITARYFDLTPWELLSYEEAPRLLETFLYSTFSFMDVVFYIVAIVTAFRLAYASYVEVEQKETYEGDVTL